MSLLIFLLIVPYLAPTGIAAYRDLRDKNAVFLLNLLVGWTVLGWVLALVWACIGDADGHVVAAAGDERGPRGLLLQGRDRRT